MNEFLILEYTGPETAYFYPDVWYLIKVTDLFNLKCIRRYDFSGKNLIALQILSESDYKKYWKLRTAKPG